MQAWSGFSWQADYPDPQNFIDILFRSDSSINYGNYANQAVDDYINLAQTEKNASRRAGYYTDAEQLIVSDAAWLPLWWGVDTKALIKPWVKDYVYSSFTIERFKDVWIGE